MGRRKRRQLTLKVRTSCDCRDLSYSNEAGDVYDTTQSIRSIEKPFQNSRSQTGRAVVCQGL